MVHNLALSLRHHSPDVKVHLFISDYLQQFIQADKFDTVQTIQEDEFTDHRGIAPAKIKARVYELGRSIGLEMFLYLDVDAIILNDLTSFFTALKGHDIATEVLGTGNKDSKSINYSIWATNENIWNYFELKDDDTLCGIQSSWMYFERSEVCDKLQEYLTWYMLKGIPYWILKQQWNNAIPDELIYQGVFAKMGLIPNKPPSEKKTILFGNKRNKETPESAERDYYILSIYGNDKLTQKKWLKLYDRHLSEIDRMNYHPQDMLMRDKFVSTPQ